LAASQDPATTSAAAGDLSQGGSADGSRSGSTAGAQPGVGFDTSLGRILVEKGILPQPAIDECLEELRARAAQNRATTLADLLQERNLVAADQIAALKAEAAKPAAQIPGFQIIRKLGQGAMAKVYLARQLSLDRLVAIKVLPRDYSNNPNFIARFQKEGRAAASLSHNNIVGAVEIGETNGLHYFVMEYIDGDTVFDRIAARKRLPPKEALQIIRQVASALEHAHARGFIHRDVKPRNIMMTLSGVAKLADLGLARMTSDKALAESEAGRAYGTPFYISPEQIQGKIDIGPPADIYGLGATFYHMVTGRVPFEAKNQTEVMKKHLAQPLTPPDHLVREIPPEVAQIIEKMLAKDPLHRYHNATDLIHDIDLVLAGKQPEFARPLVDIATIASAVDEQEPVQIVRKESGGILSNPLVLTLVAFLTLSVLGNIVLLAMLLGR